MVNGGVIKLASSISS
ncbi:Protein of unknown function [Escherichia coli]|nr:Protein of unknown function [Escherichia coli]CDU41627.1 Protein of unknown function [Escherichia coli]